MTDDYDSLHEQVAVLERREAGDKEYIALLRERITERDATIVATRAALKHALSLCLQPPEDFDEADSEWCHNQRAALERP